MALQTPPSIQAEHRELHAALHRAMDAGGRTGQAARTVAKLLAPHFEKEELYAMPPLALLGPLARGEAAPDAAVLELADRLKAELPAMLDEHGRIRAALGELAAAARAEGHAEIDRFAERLAAHAQNEEEILYPAAILVGEYLRLRRGAARG